jgi:hypothetical protein
MRWISRTLILLSLAGSSVASNAAPAPSTADQNGIVQNLHIQSLNFASFEPSLPIAGQVAQITFDVEFLGDPKALNVDLGSFLTKRLVLTIDGKSVFLGNDVLSVQGVNLEIVPSAKVAANDVLVPRHGNAKLTAMFEWPAPANGGFGYGRTVAQLVSLSDAGHEAGAARNVIPVSIPTSEGFYYNFAVLLFVVLFGTAFFWRRYLMTEGKPFANYFKRKIRVEHNEPAIVSNTIQDKKESIELQAPELRIAAGVSLAATAPRVPDSLVTALANGQAVLVVGSELSAQAGVPAGLPLLLKLIEGLGEHLPTSFKSIFSTDNVGSLGDISNRFGGASKVMDAVVSSATPEAVVRVLAQLVSSVPENSQLHQWLSEFRWQAVIDLTWDQLVERSFIDRIPADSSPFVKYELGDSSMLSKAMRSGEQLLLKPFGSLDRAASLSLTIEEFRRKVGRSPEFSRALSALMQSRTFLFLGVEPETLEQFVQIATSDLEGIELKHFALLPEDPLNDLRQKSLGRFGIQILPFDVTNAASAFSIFVKNMRRAVRRANGAVPGVQRTSILSPDRITRIKLESIGPFETLDLAPDPSTVGTQPTNSPWWVIFGGNGVGKSSILRAVALVLAGDSPAALEAGKRLLRAGTSQGLIEVHMGGRCFAPAWFAIAQLW